MLESYEAPKTIELKIEQRHIDAGVRVCAGKCPIALAAKELFPNFYATLAFADLIIVRTELDDRRGGNPRYDNDAREILSFTRAFDSGKPVYPMTMHLKRVN